MNLIEIQQERLKVLADIKILTNEFKKTLKQKEQAASSLDKQEQLLLNDINQAAKVFATVQSRGYRVESELWRDSMAQNLRCFRRMKNGK